MPAIEYRTLCENAQEFLVSLGILKVCLDVPMRSSIWPLLVEVQAERIFLEKRELSTVE